MVAPVVIRRLEANVSHQFPLTSPPPELVLFSFFVSELHYDACEARTQPFLRLHLPPLQSAHQASPRD